MMNDLQRELPAMAYIEAQVIHRALSGGTLQESVRAIEAQYDLEPGSLGTGVFLETRIACLLYCLILIPKEIWSLPPNHEVYKRIREKWSADGVTIKRERGNYSADPVYSFIHHLRNAVAHAHLFIANGKFEFGDRRSSEKKLSFEASLSVNDLQNFLRSWALRLQTSGTNRPPNKPMQRTRLRRAADRQGVGRTSA